MNSLTGLHQRLVRKNYDSGIERLVFYVLIPFSVVFGALIRLRSVLYRVGIISSYRSRLPVISIGNLAAGGTGKTPVVDWLIKKLQQQGRRPAVVSRGYGGRFRGKVGLVSDGNSLLMDAVAAGDEPILLARRNPDVPVLIARRRVDAIQRIEQLDCADVVVLDDGFQHLAVRRDVDLVLVDATQPFGNGWPLPAGNLRGFQAELQRADAVLMTRVDQARVDLKGNLPIYYSAHRLADRAVSLRGESVSIDALRTLRFLAFAGIARPEGFFTALEAAGLKIDRCLSFADHQPYNPEQIVLINQASTDVEALVTTEKDGVKLDQSHLDRPCYQVPLALVVADEDNFFQLIIRKIQDR